MRQLAPPGKSFEPIVMWSGPATPERGKPHTHMNSGVARAQRYLQPSQTAVRRQIRCRTFGLIFGIRSPEVYISEVCRSTLLLAPSAHKGLLPADGCGGELNQKLRNAIVLQKRWEYVGYDCAVGCFA